MGPRQVNFFFWVWASYQLAYVCWCLLWCMLSAFRCHSGCHIDQWGNSYCCLDHCSPFGVYPWEAYVHPSNGHLFLPGIYQVAVPSTALSRSKPCATQSAVLQPLQQFGGVYSFGGSAVTQSLCPPIKVGTGLCFQVWFHLMRWLTLNLWWVLNLVILVWWLDIGLMSLLTPGLQSGLLLIHTFILGLQ